MLTYVLSKGRIDLNQLISYLANGLGLLYSPSTIFRNVSALHCTTFSMTSEKDTDILTCDNVKISIKKDGDNYEMMIDGVAKITTTNLKYGYIKFPSGMYEVYLLR